MKGNTLPNGQVVLTSAYNLPSKYIIHTVGPKIDNEITKKDRIDLRNCYYNTLKLAKENNIKTIAFPCISTGLYGFDNQEASKIAINTIKKFIGNNKYCFNHIIFNVYKDIDLKIYNKNIMEVK